MKKYCDYNLENWIEVKRDIAADIEIHVKSRALRRSDKVEL
jgi:hypothetical protein